MLAQFRPVPFRPTVQRIGRHAKAERARSGQIEGNAKHLGHGDVRPLATLRALLPAGLAPLNPLRLHDAKGGTG